MLLLNQNLKISLLFPVLFCLVTCLGPAYAGETKPLQFDQGEVSDSDSGSDSDSQVVKKSLFL